jgi:O-Antigen ligase
MFLILIIDAIVLITLIGVARRRGVEDALPYFAFFVTLLPEECRITLPGLFDLYTHRLALIALVILFVISKTRNAVRTLPLKNLIYLHIAWVCVSTLASIVVMTSVKQLLAQVFEYYLVFYICTKSIRDVRTIAKITNAMIAAISVACIIGLFEIYSRWSVLSLFPLELQQTYGTGDPLYVEMMDRGVRVRSTFPHPILFGGAISMMIPLALHLLATAKSRLYRALLTSSLILMFWNLYKTTSRGPWLATIISISLLLLGSEARLRKWVVAVACLAVLCLIVRPGVAETIWSAYRATLDPDTQMGASFQYRPALFHTVTKTLNETPGRALVGFGLGSFREKGLVIELKNIETHRWYTCDSSWILFMYETGYIGFLILAALLCKPALMALHGYRTLPKTYRYFSLACFTSFASYFVVMISVAIYGWGQNGHMLWLLAAMTVSYIALVKKKQKSRVPPEPRVEVIAVGPEDEMRARQSNVIRVIFEHNPCSTLAKGFQHLVFRVL